MFEISGKLVDSKPFQPKTGVGVCKYTEFLRTYSQNIYLVNSKLRFALEFSDEQPLGDRLVLNQRDYSLVNRAMGLVHQKLHFHIKEEE